MWPRKQLDIGWMDLAYGVGQVFLPFARPNDERVAGTAWIPAREALVCLSVRTGWDLLLSVLRLPPGSEVIMSAVTVPDMARIVRHHGLVPVPVDVDAATLEPSLDELEEAITPRTRAILVAHLFGSRIDMGPIVELAREHKLLVIEDCAQAYVGRAYAGHPESDACLFSFGPIKTATALGGAVLRIRDTSLRADMARRQRNYPVQSRWFYFTRLLKYAALRAISMRYAYGALVGLCRTVGVDYDYKFATIAKSFAAEGFFEHIRRQPCMPLVRLLRRRLATYDQANAEQLCRRTARGRRVADDLAAGLVPGGENPTNTYWVLPVRIGTSNGAESALQQAGFDATGRSSLVVVPYPDAAATDGLASRGSADPPPRLAPWLEETVFLPNGDAMTGDEFERMRTVLGHEFGNGKATPTHERESVERARVPVAP